MLTACYFVTLVTSLAQQNKRTVVDIKSIMQEKFLETAAQTNNIVCVLSQNCTKLYNSYL